VTLLISGDDASRNAPDSFSRFWSEILHRSQYDDSPLFGLCFPLNGSFFSLSVSPTTSSTTSSPIARTYTAAGTPTATSTAVDRHARITCTSRHSSRPIKEKDRVTLYRSKRPRSLTRETLLGFGVGICFALTSFTFVSGFAPVVWVAAFSLDGAFGLTGGRGSIESSFGR